MRAVNFCLTCGHPTDATATEPGQQWRCDCEPDVTVWQQAQEPERFEPWHLCVLCARDYAPLRSRFAWLACPTCLTVNHAVGDQWGRDLQLPLGRHSIMNGQCISFADLDPAVLDERIGALVRLSHTWQTLYQWRDAELARVVAALPAKVRTQASVPVDQFPRLAHPTPRKSERAWLRFRGITSLSDLAAIRDAVDDLFHGS